jgi:SNF family Na+-dependent transporter
MMELLSFLVSQTDTSTMTDAGTLGTLVFDTFTAFGVSVLAGLGSLFALLFAASKFTGLEFALSKTSADWVVWVVRAVSAIGTAVVGAIVASAATDSSLVMDIFAALVATFPVAWRYIQRAYEEATD